MKTIQQVEKFSDKKFQKTFGVNRTTFATMLEVLQNQCQEAHKKGGRKPKRYSTGFVFFLPITATDVQSQI